MGSTEETINTQREQITRYQTRLKDVVTAYKSLLKEKEAVDASLAAISNNLKDSDGSNDSTSTQGEKDGNMTVLMNSIATLTKEKANMDLSFQNDKKQLRLEIAAKEKLLNDTKSTLKQTLSTLKIEKENYKSKIIVIRHESEREKSDLMVMLKECQKLLGDERHLKENLEMQLNDLKTQFSQTSNSDRAMSTLTKELDSTKKKLKSYESTLNKDKESEVMRALQTEMELLRKQYSADLLREKTRAIDANETKQKLIELHEQRVQMLEGKISDLSQSFASYHSMKEKDQESISRLKDKISQLKSTSELNSKEETKQKQFTSVQSLIDEIDHLKHTLMVENSKLENPKDISGILNHPKSANSDANEMLKLNYDKSLNEIKSLNLLSIEQKQNIKTLQDKIKVLNRNIDEYELESTHRSKELKSELKAERNKWLDLISSQEIEFRSKVSQLEQQLQKQRDRSLVLLEEKEVEIKNLKSSYDVLSMKQSKNNEHDDDSSSDFDCVRKPSATHLSAVLNSTNSSIPDTHLIYYSNELLRREAEITSIRKGKRETENLLRKALIEKVMIQESLDDKIMKLELQVDRLERGKSREFENLEYLKNVVLNFITTTDTEGKKKMLNAIGAVLKFDSTEINSVNTFLNKKK
ncbi:unnamed protein product [Diamesa serratosioi]